MTDRFVEEEELDEKRDVTTIERYGYLVKFFQKSIITKLLDAQFLWELQILLSDQCYNRPFINALFNRQGSLPLDDYYDYIANKRYSDLVY